MNGLVYIAKQNVVSNVYQDFYLPIPHLAMSAPSTKQKVSSKANSQRSASLQPKASAKENSAQPVAKLTYNDSKKNSAVTGKVPRTASQYTIDSMQGLRCTICDKIPRFNKNRFGHLVNYADRLNLVLFLFGLS